MEMNENEILEYLDFCINEWRDRNEDINHIHHNISLYYIDAFQSVRSSLFGSTLPLRVEEKVDENLC